MRRMVLHQLGPLDVESESESERKEVIFWLFGRSESE